MLESAVQAADRSPDVFLTVTTRLELGRALHKEGHDDQAIEVLRVAGDGAHNLDAPLLAEETVAQLRACGSRPVRLAQRGIESLTPAQLRTVRLAASGSTNTEIARTLFISVKTVESHLARGYRKLGVRSRRELADVLDD
jgi:DNA-binding CsgD family transcriptional regulator